MIATRNRREDLARTCGVIGMLRPQPAEVLVTLDGCTDGSLEFLEEFHPTFRLIRHEPARGSIASRDAMLRAATADLVLSLDDDSYPLEPDFLARAAALFEANPKLAIVDFAQRSDEYPETLEGDNVGPFRATGSYSSAGAMLRRSVYLELGGYEPDFFHAYEEPDYALRCHAAGYEIQAVPSPTVRHHFTPAQRNEMRTHHFHARNELWSVLMRCPLPWLLPVALFRTLRQATYALRRGPAWLMREPLWWLRCAQGARPCWRKRRPLPWSKYLAWMRAVRRG